MTTRGSSLRAVLQILAVFVVSWGVSHAFANDADERRERPREAMAAPTGAQYDSATRVIHGVLTTLAADAVRPAMRSALGVLVVLRAADVRTCEDLGRQLRELQSRSPGMPMVAVADTVDLLGAFVRRERLRASVVQLAAAAVVEGVSALPTPAVLVMDETGGRVAGVAHPRRFANARVRSFADELAEHVGRADTSFRDRESHFFRR
jgi:hypothetical protein